VFLPAAAVAGSYLQASMQLHRWRADDSCGCREDYRGLGTARDLAPLPPPLLADSESLFPQYEPGAASGVGHEQSMLEAATHVKF